MTYPLYNEHTGCPTTDNQTRAMNRQIKRFANELYQTFGNRPNSRKAKKAYKKSVMPGYLGIYRDLSDKHDLMKTTSL